MKNQAIDRLLEILPSSPSHQFSNTEYPMPLQTTLLGNDKLDINCLRSQLMKVKDADAKDMLEPLLLAAELIEASSSDKSDYFITDARVRDYVFMGSKWRAGWALVLGKRNQMELISLLKEKGYYVFTDSPDIEDTYFIGDRPTSPIYFLQMMVRYGLIWGRILPGDDHEMGHFLEKDMPGFMVITEELEPLKYLVALGIMKLGAPALVPESFPFPYGRRIATDDPARLVGDGLHFPNLRIRYYNDEIIAPPDGCNAAYVNEAVKDGTTYGGTPLSFFFLRPSGSVFAGIHIVGETSPHIGIRVEIENEALSDDMAQIVEQTAMKAVNYQPGVKAGERGGHFYIRTAPDVSLDCIRIGEAIRYGIRLHYPRLDKIGITILFDEEALAQESREADRLKAQRREWIKNMTEENTQEFCACIECRPFSLEHTCIMTPDRIPMCASRTYFSVKAESLFGTSVVPFRRQSDKDRPLKLVFPKGNVLDLERGEYEGCNKIYGELTSGRLSRVYLHSLRGYPHTSCGCFQNLAFWMEEVHGIGIMSRGSKAVAPNGMTWDKLANYAGGKQSDGIMGVSLHYIQSRHFLKGDGGIGNVVWADGELYQKIAGNFLPGQKVATEKDAGSMEELTNFLKR